MVSFPKFNIDQARKNFVVLSSTPGVRGSAELAQRSIDSAASISSFDEPVKISISASTNLVGNKYSPFFPTREGFSSATLAAAVENPGAESFSLGKTLNQVATAARQNLDQKYAALKASGSPFDVNSFEGKDWYALFGDLDRRALYAVASNQDGQFTQQEQDLASSIMSQQQGLAMGSYSGPTSQAGKFVDSFAGNDAGRMKAAMQWLDGVSADEKSSASWAFSRASVEGSYSVLRSDKDEPVEKFASDSPLVKVILAAMKKAKEGLVTHGRIESFSDLKNQAWFKGFESALDDAIQQVSNREKQAPYIISKYA